MGVLTVPTKERVREKYTRQASAEEVLRLKQSRVVGGGQWVERFRSQAQFNREKMRNWHMRQAGMLGGGIIDKRVIDSRFPALKSPSSPTSFAGTASHAGIYAPLGVRGIVGRFYRRYEPLVDGGWPALIGFMNSETNQETETYKLTAAQHQMSKWQGERQAKQKKVYSYTITNEVFEMSDEFSTDDFRRDKTGQILQRVGEMSAIASDHWEELLTTLIETGTTTADYTGDSFFSAHSTNYAGTLNNNVAAAQLPSLAVTNSSRPTQTEAAKICTELFEHFLTFTDENARPINGTLKQICVMVPPNMLSAFVGATQSDRLDDNSSNVLRSNSGRFTVVVECNPFLSTAAPTVGYAYRTDTDTRSLIMQEEVPILARALGLGSEYEVFNRQVFFGVEAVRNVGFGDPGRAIRFTLS